MRKKPADDRKEAERILNKYGGGVDDFFKLWPPDKKYFFSDDGNAFIAYAVKNKVAVALFDPNGKSSSISKVLSKFSEYAKERGWQIIFVQSTEESQIHFKNNGFNRLVVGADALISTIEFSDKTVRSKYFRNLMNRMYEKGYSLSEHLPPHSPKLIKELRDISDNWLTLPNHKEWSFLTGRFSKDYLQKVPLFVLRDSNSQALAFVNQLPTYKNGVVTIDLMRRRVKSPPNTMDFLLISLILKLEKDGIEWFNLGLSPIDGNHFANNGVEKIVNLMFGIFQKFIGFKGLHQYKAKWAPHWEPRYVWYTGSSARLVTDGLAILKLLTEGTND